MRVVEISNLEGAAGFAGKLFRRWGAEVIRVESRDRRPPEIHRDLYVNGGKNRLQINFNDEEDLSQLESLVNTADLLISDFTPAELDRYVSGPLKDSIACPQIFITNFGRQGPYRNYEGTSATLNAMGSYTWLSGDPGREPLTLPSEYCYYQAGSYAYVLGLSELLYGKNNSIIDISVFETLASLHQFTDTMWIFDKQVRSRHGNRFQNLCPTTLLPAQDGWVGFNILPNFWPAFALWVGGTELAEKEEWLLNTDRMRYEDEIESIIKDFLKDKSVRDVLKDGQETWRVPVGISVPLSKVFDDPQLKHRGFFKPIDGLENVESPISPFTISGFQAQPDEQVMPFSNFEDINMPTETPVSADKQRNPLDRPLSGLRIADMTRIWSGPVCARILGDLGADVIKIEAPTGRGPMTSPVVPQNSGVQEQDLEKGQLWNRHSLNNKLNRNKRSVSIDLKTEEGKEIFRKIVQDSDVLIENFSVRAMPSLGLDYESLRAINPSLIYIAMPALGREGPYKAYVGLGPSIEPLSGLPEIMGYSESEPRVTSMALTDAAAGVTAATAVLTALQHREETGEGSLVDLSQSEAMAAYLGEYYIQTQLEGTAPSRIGNDSPSHAFQAVLRCAPLATKEFNSHKPTSDRPSDVPLTGNRDDEWLTVTCRDESEWIVFSEFAGKAWHENELFLSPDARRLNRSALMHEMNSWSRGFDKHELLDSLQSQGIPSGAVLSPPELLSDRHLEDTGYFSYTQWATGEEPQSDGFPVMYDGLRRYDWWSGPPALGEANEEILSRIGYSDSEIEIFFEQGIIVDKPPV